MQATTIKLFLVRGNPNGLRTAELSNWSGKAVAAPRTEISDLLKRGELTSPGFYLLTGVDPESGEDAIYIGEAENVANRLKGLCAKGKRAANGFVVFSGSQAVLENRPSAKRMGEERDELVEKGILAEKDGHLTFTKDVEFGSPSTAGSIVRGGNSNGLTVWKNAAKVTLKELEENPA